MKYFSFGGIIRTIIIICAVAMVASCKGKRRSSTPSLPPTPLVFEFTLKVEKAADASITDSVNGVWEYDSATDAQLANGVKIEQGQTITLTAYSTKPNIIWNGKTSGNTLKFTINNDTTIQVAFIPNPFTLTLKANAGYTLQAYTDRALTRPVADITKIPVHEAVYIKVPKPLIGNQTVNISGADDFIDTVAFVLMNSDKTVSATYVLDTNNFIYIVNANQSWVSGYKGLFQNIAIPDTIQGAPVTAIVKAPGGSKFGELVSSIIIPNGVVTIGNSAFEGCNALQSIILPYALTTIGDSAFYGCSSLSYIAIPNKVTSIGRSMFHECIALSSIKLPSDLENIGDSAFYSCYALNNVDVPRTIKTFGVDPFYNCNALTSIIMRAVLPPLTSTPQGGIFGSKKGAPVMNIAVPSNNSIPAYQTFWTDPALGVGWGGRISVTWSIINF